MGEVVEHDHEVRLDERRQRHAHGIPGGAGDGRLEGGDGLIAERADRAAGETGHALGREDLAPGDEGSEGGQRVRGRGLDDGQVRRVVHDADRSGRGSGETVADLQEPARTDAKEAVAAQALPSLDGFQQVGGGHAVVQAQEGTDRGLEVRRARGPQEDRVRGGGQASRFLEAERVGHDGRSSRIRKRPSSSLPGRKVVDPPRCHPRSAVCRTRDRRTVRGSVLARPIDRRCPVSLALCAGAYWSSAPSGSALASSSVAPRSVRGLPGPFAAAAIPARTSRRVSVMTHAGYSSRSMPVFGCGPEYGGGRSGASSVARCRPPCPARRRSVHRPGDNARCAAG